MASGTGYYVDWLRTAEPGHDFINVTWGLSMSLETPLRPDLFRDGIKVWILFDLHGAGAITHFRGEVTLDAERWVRRNERGHDIDLYFMGSDRLSEDENKGFRDSLKQIPVAFVLLDTPIPIHCADLLRLK